MARVGRKVLRPRFPWPVQSWWPVRRFPNLDHTMIPAFSRSNNIGDLPAVLVNKIFASTWWQEVLHWFGHFRRRLYYREAMNPGNPRTMIFTHMDGSSRVPRQLSFVRAIKGQEPGLVDVLLQPTEHKRVRAAKRRS